MDKASTLDLLWVFLSVTLLHWVAFLAGIPHQFIWVLVGMSFGTVLSYQSEPFFKIGGLTILTGIAYIVFTMF